MESYENGKRSEQIDNKYHFIKDLVVNGSIQVFYVPTEENVADLLTKSLAREKQESLRKILPIA